MQVLLDDEWHPLHQVIYYSPSRILTSFGNADYSIPLVLFYFLQHRLFGLSELGLRLPMVIAGTATVAALPCFVRRHVGDRVASMFALFLAASPILVSFSRIARSYAVTLLGIYFAFWCLDRAIVGRSLHWRWAWCYCVLCGLVVWAHPITGPMLIAPLIALWWAALRREGIEARALVGLTMLVGVSMALAVLPPLLGDPQALAGKAGVDQMGFGTFLGAWFLWLGTGSTAVAWVGLGLALIGARRTWESVTIARWIVIGALITVLALFIAKPWWIDRSLALARYLLPLAPVVLLCACMGLMACVDAAMRLAPPPVRASHIPALIAMSACFALWWRTGPYDELLRYPNSYTQHSYFQYDYRKENNPVRIGQAAFPASTFWSTLASGKAGSVTVAVAPFRYSTYEWPAPLWEIQSRQRVIPAFVWGTCEPWRHGEVPPRQGFDLKNAVHLIDAWSGFSQQVDYLAYYKSPRWNNVSPPLPQCEAWMREHLGRPTHEDDALIVWRNPGSTKLEIESNGSNAGNSK